MSKAKVQDYRPPSQDEMFNSLERAYIKLLSDIFGRTKNDTFKNIYIPLLDNKISNKGLVKSFEKVAVKKWKNRGIKTGGKPFSQGQILLFKGIQSIIDSVVRSYPDDSGNLNLSEDENRLLEIIDVTYRYYNITPEVLDNIKVSQYQAEYTALGPISSALFTFYEHVKKLALIVWEGSTEAVKKL